MELLFESTDKFEKDLNQFNDQEKSQIVEELNCRCATLKNGFKTFYKQVVRPLKIKLNNGFESSLYSLQVNREVRVILTVDDDPLFEQIIITLMRVVRHKDLKKTFRGIAESLYHGYINSISRNQP
jgi:hypothetical protein